MSLASCATPTAAFARRSTTRSTSRVASRRRASSRALSVRAGAPLKTPEECKDLLDREGYRMLDIRPFKAYDREHLTKPPQCTTNTPWSEEEDVSKFIARVENQGLRPLSKLLIADFDGECVQAAADALFEAGFTEVIAVQGGYNGWRSIYTTCGRKRPPTGKWISTGKGGESLKSGLTLDPNVAAAYEENWGKEPPKHGEKGESLAASSGQFQPPPPSVRAPPTNLRPPPPGGTVAPVADVVLQPLAMDVEIAEKRKKAMDNGLTENYKEPASGGDTWGSNWDTYYTEDDSRTPYYVNRVSGKTQWEEPKRWWSSGRWVDAE